MQKNQNLDIDWATLNHTRKHFGANFFRHFGYFTQDGPRSVQAIEDAMRAMNAAKMVLPANRLAEDAFLFGAIALGGLAESIESQAQRCVSEHVTPDAMLRDVLTLRPLYFTTVARLEREVSPLLRRKGSMTQSSARKTTMQFV